MELHKSTKRALFFLSIAVFLILSIRFLSHSTFANTDPPPPTSRPYVATRDMKRIQQSVQRLRPGDWHAVVLELEHSA